MNDYLGWVVAAFTILGGGGIFGWWKSTKPRRERSQAADDAILGEAAVLDRFGGEMDPGKPGLVARVADLEHGFQTLTQIVADQQAMRDDIQVLKKDVKSLQDARLERLVTHAESAHMWKAVAGSDFTPPEVEE